MQKKNEQGAFVVLAVGFIVFFFILSTACISLTVYRSKRLMTVASRVRAQRIAASGTQWAVAFLQAHMSQNTIVSFPYVHTESFDDDMLSIHIEDEDSKIPLFSLVQPDGSINNDMRTIITQLFKVKQKDIYWMDPLIMLLSDKKNSCSFLWQIDKKLRTPFSLFESMHDAVTLISSGRININTVSPLVLLASVPELGEQRIKALLCMRASQKIDSWDALEKSITLHTALSRIIQSWYAFTSNYFKILSTGTYHRQEVTDITYCRIDKNGPVVLFCLGD